jgi:hypothetical protein
MQSQLSYFFGSEAAWMRALKLPFLPESVYVTGHCYRDVHVNDES